MLPGFNHNIRYKDRIYHIQTEDNGEETHLVISHIFIGGNIIATKKTDYLHILGSKNMIEELRLIMEKQHKELIKEILSGKYDALQTTEAISPTHPDREESRPASDIINQHIEQPQKDEMGSQTSHFKPVDVTHCFTVFGEKTISEETLDRIILKFLEKNK